LFSFSSASIAKAETVRGFFHQAPTQEGKGQSGDGHFPSFHCVSNLTKPDSFMDDAAVPPGSEVTLKGALASLTSPDWIHKVSDRIKSKSSKSQ
jgi:hypothetical protein